MNALLYPTNADQGCFRVHRIFCPVGRIKCTKAEQDLNFNEQQTDMKSAILLIFLMTTISAGAQMTGIRGHVANDHNAPLSYSYVLLLKNDSSLLGTALADTAGNFEFTGINTGVYFIAVEMAGYPKYQSSLIHTDTGVVTLPDIIMAPTTSNMAEVRVTAKKKLYEMQADKLVVNVENSVLADGNSTFELLRRTPSVTIDKNENILLKGMGCRIYIDGKPSYLKGSQLTDHLKALRSDAISRIEIMSNPSSRYDAEGNGGIINIRLKKNASQGLNGTANIGVGQGKYPKENAGLNVNYRQGRFNVFGNGYTGHSESYNRLTYNSKVREPDTMSYRYRDQYWHPLTSWVSYKAGIDNYFSKNTVIGLVVTGNVETTKARTDNNTYVTDEWNDPIQYIDVLKMDTTNNSDRALNLNSRTQLDTAGGELTIDADLANYIGRTISSNTNNFYNINHIATRPPYVFRNIQPYTINIRSLKADLVYTVAGIKLETGGKYSNVVTDNDLIADSIRQGRWVRDNGRSSHFIYDETISAAYLTGSKTTGRTSLQAGLRAEHTHSNGTSMTMVSVQERRYTNLFPSLFMTYALTDDHEMSLSYTRRIQRPRYQDLNPFTIYVDPYTLFAGNPYLRPSYTHSVEVKHGFRQVLFTSLSYNQTTGDHATVVLQDKAIGITTNTTANERSSDFLYLTVMTTLEPSKIWSFTVNTDISYGTNRSDIPGFSYHSSFFNANISTSHSFNLPHNYKLQTSAYYSLPTHSGLTYLLSDYGWDLGIQKLLLKKRMTLKLNASSIIGPTAYRAHIVNEGIDVTWVNKWEGRRVTASCAWKFGSAGIKASREHNSAVQDEKNRVK